MGRALIYARESKWEDRAGNRSPEEQVAESTAWCRAAGHTPIEVDGQPAIIDSGIGASRHSRGTRDGWERAKALIASGDVDLLVTWSNSRAQRDLSAYAELRDLCAGAGVLWAYKGRVHDLASSADRFTTGLEALLAEREADEISENVQRAMRANAAQGRPHGRQLYGYRRIYDPTTKTLLRVEPHPDQAPVVQRIFADYLAGHGARTIANALNAEGVPTTTGAAWRPAGVRRLLERPGYAGRRVHHGDDTGDAMWPPLIDQHTWERAQARIAGRRPTHRQSWQANLLAGLARCADCGERTTMARHRRADRTMVVKYACDSCYAALPRDRLDAWATERLLDRIRSAGSAARDVGPSPAVVAARAEVKAIQAELEEAMDLWHAKRLSVAAYAEMEGTLRARLAAAERAARADVVPLTLKLPKNLDHLDAWWDAKTPEQRREVMAGMVAAVLIRKVVPKWARYDVGDHATVEWRHPAG